MEIKDDLHKLIDQTDNNGLLEIVYQLLNTKGVNKEGELLKSLTPEQKKELYEAYDESFDDSKLIDLEQVRKKHSKWLERLD